MPWCPRCGAEYREGFSRCSECDVELADAPPAEPRITTSWETVGVFTTAEEARLAQGYLRNAGVVAHVLDLEMHVAPYGMAVLGEVQLMTPAGEAERARTLLAEAAPGGGVGELS